MVSLNSWSSGSMKQIPRNLLALSSFGFSIAHFLPLLQLNISSQFSPRDLAINDLAWMLTAVLSVSPWTTYIRLEVSLSIK